MAETKPASEFTPENGCLGDDPVSFWGLPIFSGKLLVLGSVYSIYI